MFASIGGAVMPWESGAVDYTGGISDGLLQHLGHAVPAILGVVAVLVCFHIIIAMIYRYVAHAPFAGGKNSASSRGGSFGSDDIDYDGDGDDDGSF